MDIVKADDFAPLLSRMTEDEMLFMKNSTGIWGENFADVVSFLTHKKRDKKFHYLVRSNSWELVPVKSLRGKYVLVFCFVFPPTDEVRKMCEDIGFLCQHMSTTKHPFEAVLVAKPPSTPGDSYDPDDLNFRRFLSTLAAPCLYMPLWDSLSLDKVWESMNLIDDGPDKYAVVVGPHGEPLQMDYHFLRFGAASFPFTKQHIETLKTMDEELKNRLDPFRALMFKGSVNHPKELTSRRPVSLAELLNCNSLKRIGADMTDPVVPLSDLEQEVVGLYLCIDGSFMDKLISVQKQCIEQELSFEIVFICLPYVDYRSSFFKQLPFHKAKVLSWLDFPFNDIICRSLWRVCGFSCHDKLIIVPPGGQPCDRMGEAVISHYGIEAHPFTRWSMLEKKLAIFEELTLESVLFSESNYLVPINDGHDVYSTDPKGKKACLRVPLTHLLGRKVLLYMDFFYGVHDEGLHSLLCKRFPVIQAKHPDVIVVVVPLPSPHGLTFQASTFRANLFRGMRWLMLPSTAASLSKKLFPKNRNEFSHSTIVAFGEDGRICSTNARPFLSDDKLVPLLFNNDDVLREITTDLFCLGIDEAD